MSPLDPRPYWRWLVPLPLVACAIGLRWLATPLLGDALPFAFVYPAVFLSVAICGVGPAVMAAISGASLGTLLFVPSSAAVVVHLLVSTSTIVIATVLDRSRRAAQSAHASLRAQELQLRLALDAGRTGTWSYEPATGTLAWNERIAAMLGRTGGALGGPAHDFTSLVEPADRERLLGVVRETLARGAPFEVEFRVRWPDGAVHWLAATAAVLRDESGRATRLVGAATDVTARKHHDTEQERLFERERRAREEAEAANRLKDEFLATLSHELRTPLSAILGWTQLLRRGTRTEADLERGLEVIERNARAQTRLVADLLDMSRILSGSFRLEPREIDPRAIVDAAVLSLAPAATARGIRLQTSYDPLAPFVVADPARLQQIAWNLLANAIKFTPKDGNVSVRVARVDSHLELVVEDDGEGIPPEFMPYVFEKFTQADASTTRPHGGLGLGLAIVRHLAELHGGTARAHSRGAGQGARFTVELPLPTRHANQSARSARIGREAGVDLAGISVLIVDDDVDGAAALSAQLESARAITTVAHGAAAGFELVQRLRPDVLVSDIGMPGEDGYALIRKVRALPPARGGTVRAIALTAYTRPSDRERALDAGFDIHLAKPVDDDELLAVIGALTARGSGNVGTREHDPPRA